MLFLAEPDGLPSWISSGANVGAFALLSWVIWNVFTKILPSQMGSARELTIAHAETCKALVEAHAKNILDVQAQFREALRDQRQTFLEALAAQDRRRHGGRRAG